MEAMTVEEKQRFNKMEEHLEKFDDKLDKILTLLDGDAFGQHQGLVKEVKELKTRLRKLEDLKNRTVWIILGAGTAAGLTMDKLWELIKQLIS